MESWPANTVPLRLQGHTECSHVNIELRLQVLVKYWDVNIEPIQCVYGRDYVAGDGRYLPSQGDTKITTYLPETNKRRIPLGVILAVAIGVPVVLVVCLFGAVWLQELGIL
ncbi:hypothetical protein Y032_0592g403 [Ancylostoma ceylanicum]|nr:hypothetical protein Y032_0592g403 [Ancylostoma ceylanicum]